MNYDVKNLKNMDKNEIIDKLLSMQTSLKSALSENSKNQKEYKLAITKLQEEHNTTYKGHFYKLLYRDFEIYAKEILCGRREHSGLCNQLTNTIYEQKVKIS